MYRRKLILVIWLLFVSTSGIARSLTCDLHLGLTPENVDFKDSGGDTALWNSVDRYRAAYMLEAKIVKQIHNVQPDKTENCLASIEALLKLGADPNLKRGDGRDWSVFNFSYRMGVILEPVMDLLLDYGADINGYDGRGGFGLWTELRKFTDEQLDKYLAMGADPNIPAIKGRSRLPIETLVSYNEVEKVKIFLKHGANPNHKRKNNVPMIVWAAALGHWEIVLALFNAGADLNAVNKEGMSALHYAGGSNKEMYEKLIEKGANDRLISNRGKTPFHYYEMSFQ